MMSSHARKAAILDYWRACARLSAWPAAPALSGDAGPGRCIRAGATLPWETGAPPAAGSFAIYCGVDGRNDIRRIVTEALGTAAGFDGDAYLFSLSVDAAGCLLPGSVRLSPRAWVANCCRTPGPSTPDWLFGFELADRTLAADVERLLVESHGRGRGAPIDYGDLLGATRHLAGELDLPELARGIEIRIASGNERKIAGKMREQWLSAAAADDLALIAHKLRNLMIGPGLRNYLATPEEAGRMQRVDIGTTALPLFQYLAPAHFPQACWPVAEVAVPRLGEQFAVNAMLKTLRHGAGLFAVESLPGAGKTAVLRDMVAAVLVERANRLARLERPELAFVGERHWEATPTGHAGDEAAFAHATESHTVSLWDERLQGFEMVLVAWDEEGLTRGLSAFPEAGPAVSGSLRPGSGKLPDMGRSGQIAVRIDDPDLPQRLGTRLMADRLAPAAVTDTWRAAVASFREAVAEERRLRDIRSAKFDDFVARGNTLQEIDALEAGRAAIAAREVAARQEVDAALTAHALAVCDLDLAEELLRKHHARRPGLMAIAFSLGDDLSEWQVSGRGHEIGHEHAARRLAEAEIRLECRRRAWAALHQEHEDAAARLAALRERAAVLKTAQGTDRSEFGDRYPASIDWDDPAVVIAQPTPWSDPAWRKARDRVFDEAVRLHRTFAAANAERLNRNLRAARAIMTGHLPPSTPAETAEAALISLFFVAPLLALKLSAFDTLFSRLRRESLGWVLLDEADRVPPHAAAGAIWRARRTVSFGDTAAPPCVSPLPPGIHRALRRQSGIDATWPDDSASAQQLVARASRLGCWRTSPGHGKRQIWSGLPIAGWRSVAPAPAPAENDADSAAPHSAAAMPESTG